MDDNLKFSVSYDSQHALVILDLPELDLEHESDLVLDVFPHESVFTAPPYHGRIPLERAGKCGKVLPLHIDYEKSSVTFRVPLDIATSSKGNTSDSKGTFAYGFGLLYNGPLSVDTSQELKSLSNPELHSPPARMVLMEAAENADFNAEHYGMDYIQFMIDKLGLKLNDLSPVKPLTDEQRYRASVIVGEKPKQAELIKSISEHRPVMLGMVDILLAISYDRLTNNNELNEANTHINIQRISATLSYFVEFSTVEALLRSFYRRSCTYPFYRNKDLTQLCVETLIERVRAANNRKEWLTQELFHAYDAFKTTDCAILNHYYIKDYIRYVELALDDELFLQIVTELEEALPDVHPEPLGFGEENVVQRLLKDVITQDSDSYETDSDDYESPVSLSDASGHDDDDEDGDDASSEKELTNENVLEKLMNLKLSG
ncbi:protein SHQ1 homolog [Anopheles albimanus]|uniref:Protein SHQ1 homolog n=1 Tax=Anopheles albimanus TaxID=7167 RepID=A0A182FDS9_ANOAL|nr:protein SHQ1 homolog [Anopheles albimanus]